jgi:hypothetical protein
MHLIRWPAPVPAAPDLWRNSDPQTKNTIAAITRIMQESPCNARLQNLQYALETGSMQSWRPHLLIAPLSYLRMQGFNQLSLLVRQHLLPLLQAAQQLPASR